MVSSGSVRKEGRARSLGISSASDRLKTAWSVSVAVTAVVTACYGTPDDDKEGGPASDGGAGGSSARGAGGDEGALGGQSSGATSGGGAETANGGASGSDGASGGSSSGGSSSGGNSSGGSSSGGSSGVPSGATPCLSDEVCAEDGLYCDELRRVCVECTNHAECPSGMACAREQVCEPFDACDESPDCGEEAPVCGEDGYLGNWCVGCSESSDCDDGESCWHDRCTPDCDEDADCAPLGQICNLTGGFCADCYIDTGCGSGEFCNGLTCQPRDCTPGAVRCLDGDTVTCNSLGSGYGGPVSCGAYGCKVLGGEGVCDLPPSEAPDDALNADGNFEDGGGDWHLDDGAVPLTNGMVCASPNDFLELGWPVDVANAALLTYQQTYTLRFRTSLELTETWGTLDLDVKIGGPAEPYVEYFSQLNVPVSAGIQDHEFTFVMEEPTGSAGIVLTFLAIESEFCVDEIWLVPSG